MLMWLEVETPIDNTYISDDQMTSQDVRINELWAKNFDDGAVKLGVITYDVVEFTGYDRTVSRAQTAVYSSVCLLAHADSWNKRMH